MEGAVGRPFLFSRPGGQGLTRITIMIPSMLMTTPNQCKKSVGLGCGLRPLGFWVGILDARRAPCTLLHSDLAWFVPDREFKPGKSRLGTLPAVRPAHMVPIRLRGIRLISTSAVCHQFCCILHSTDHCRRSRGFFFLYQLDLLDISLSTPRFGISEPLPSRELDW